MGINGLIGAFKGKKRLACTITIFGVGQFLFLTFLAAFFYPGGYNYFGHYFSDLGAVVARNGEANVISSTLFVVALTIIAITLIPFWVIICSLFTESPKATSIAQIGSILGLISSPFIIGIALFPLDTHSEIHLIITLIFFLLFAAATLLYSIAILVTEQYPNLFAVLGFLLFTLGFMPFLDLFTPYGAFLQTIVVYGYFIWVLIPIILVWSTVVLKNVTST